jgi:hypothetical protein
MKIAAFKVKSRNQLVLTFDHSNLNIWSYRSPSDANSIFFGFLTQRPINAPNFSKKICHMREIWIFKDDKWILPANRFCEETSSNYVPKHLNWHSNYVPLSQSLKISCKAIYLLFFRKIVIEVLKCKLST